MYCLVETKMWMYFWFGMASLAVILSVAMGFWVLKSKRTDHAITVVVLGAIALVIFFIGFTFLTKVMQYDADPGSAYCSQISGALLFQESK